MDDQDVLLPATYDEWLAHSPQQRDEVKSRWCAYTGEGRAFPMMAAARLMMSDARIRDIVVGIYHGGEYILRPTVSNQDYRSCRPWGPPWEDVDVFEGFRIFWTKETYEFSSPDANWLLGTWRSETPECDAEFTIAVDENGVQMIGRRLSDNQNLHVKIVEFDGYQLHIETVAPETQRPVSYRLFNTMEKDLCRGDVTFGVSVAWRRV